MMDAYPRTAPEPPESTDAAQFSSADIHHARSLLNRFFDPVAVGTPDGVESFKLGIDVIELGPLTIGRLSFGAPLTLIAWELDAYHVTIPTVGRVLARHAGHEVTACPSTGALFGPGNPVFTLHDAHTAELAVKIERPALEAELAALLGRPVEGPIDLPPVMDVSDGRGRSWSRLISLLYDELGQPDSLVHQPLIAEHIRHSVLSGLLLSVSHRYRDELATPVQPGVPRAVRRTLDMIEEEPEHPFTVAELASIAGMSVRSLQEGFRRHVGRPPMAHLQEVRLLRSHEALQRSDPSRITVAAVAHRWGFAHLGRFASAYRRRFGVSPSETLRDPGRSCHPIG